MSRGKVPISKIPLQSLVGAARAFEYGDNLNSPGDWIILPVDSTTLTKNFNSLFRHLADCQSTSGVFTFGSLHTRDKDSGLYSFDHALARAIMIRSLFWNRGDCGKEGVK